MPQSNRRRHPNLPRLACLLLVFACAYAFGDSIFTDYRGQQSGAKHRIGVQDLPQPYATRSVDNGPRLVARPRTAWPQAPAGFKVTRYASGLDRPRLIRTAPNGDLFVAESEGGRIKVLRGS